MKHYSLQLGFITETVKDGLVIFDGKQSLLYTLNGSAAYIFNKLKQHTGADKIIRAVMAKYKLSYMQAKVDVEVFIKRLIRLKILV